ncbi:MAG: 4'-phosphopantetheinyl transferase superfamily protein [Synergistaceae bacterium]|nr:4'-phosphopantetheinyl transferase superfamily protein [Synergistaceae bacterium]
METKLYLLDLGGLDEKIDERTFLEWSGMASEERLNALPRFLFRADAERTLAGEILARAALSSAAGVPPSAIRFGRGPRGKPRASVPPGVPLPEFNVSHSGRFVACAVSPQPVGVDVESVSPPDDAVLRRVCSPGESRFVRGGFLPAPAAFALIWTLKESYLKALGTGLCDDLPGIDLAAFVVSTDAEPWIFSFNGHLFRAFFHNEYAVSVCEKMIAPPDCVR